MVLTCAFNKGVCPSMPTGAPKYGHVPVDMALKNPHVQAAWTCLPAVRHPEADSPVLPALRHQKHHHEERKRNPCPQSRIRIPTRAIVTSKTSLEHATADVDNERGHTTHDAEDHRPATNRRERHLKHRLCTLLHKERRARIDLRIQSPPPLK